MDEALLSARGMMNGVTPLNTDCGRLCRAACCRPDEDGNGGMLLFPGEETFYSVLPEGWRLEKNALGTLLICSGTCDRAERPLSCMLFPLWIFPEEPGLIRPDPRGRQVCPLARRSLKALSPVFIEAAKKAAEILCRERIHREFIERIDRAIADSFYI